MGTASWRVGDMVDWAVVGANLERRKEMKSNDIKVSFCARLEIRQTEQQEAVREPTLAAATSPHGSS